MGSKPKLPPAPPPSPTPPDFASAFLGRRNKASGSLGGTFLTQGQQPLISQKQRKTVLG